MSEYRRHGDLDYTGHPVFPDPPTEELPVGEPMVYEPADFADAPADHLDEDPFKDDLSQQLAAREPQRWANRATVILVGVVLLVGGFVAGAQVEKNFGQVTKTASGTGTSNGGAQGGGGGYFGGGAGGPGGGGGAATGGGAGGAGGNGTTGTVKFVDGTTVYITTADGGTVTVKTDGSTSVLAPGAVKDLAVGSTVTVTGQTGSDGTMTASRIIKTK